ncbi:MAG TPA: hypothetical protein VD833_11785 [Vicinamibacterales bacterium]|nr:hypothetical protein [Vicinamibacterales bacterium]
MAVEPPALATVRRILLVTLILGVAGNAVELLLLGHFEDWAQRVPLVLSAVLLVALIWLGATRGPLPMRALQGVLVLSAMSGGLGVLLHYRGSMEFELEMYPSLAGFELFREAMTGATPALAPGTMLLFALIGLAYTYRHPRLQAAEVETPVISRASRPDTIRVKERES